MSSRKNFTNNYRDASYIIYKVVRGVSSFKIEVEVGIEEKFKNWEDIFQKELTIV